MKETVERKKEFIEDPRYKQCNREALMGAGLGIANLIWWFGWGYGLGSGSPSEYTYIMGFPAWFFMSSIVGAILFTVLAVIMVSKYFKEVPLETINKKEAEAIQQELE